MYNAATDVVEIPHTVLVKENQGSWLYSCLGMLAAKNSRETLQPNGWRAPTLQFKFGDVLTHVVILAKSFPWPGSGQIYSTELCNETLPYLDIFPAFY